MIETPTYITAQLEDAVKALETTGSTTYLEQLAIRAETIKRRVGRAVRIVLPPSQPGADPICIDTALRSVVFISHANTMSARFTAYASLSFKAAEAINHYFIDFLPKVAAKLK
jgi:hypothetical protein